MEDIVIDTQEQVVDTNSNTEIVAQEEVVSKEYPAGFDADTYDLTTKSIKADKVLERFELSKKEKGDLLKQNQDLRRIISKGVKAPEIEDYELTYKPDSKFEKFYNNNETTKETIQDFKNISKNAGLNTEQYKMLADFFNNTMEKAGVFDTRTEKEIEIQKQDYINSERAKLGEKADLIIKKNTEFLNSFPLFNENEKNDLMGFMGVSAQNVGVIDKIRVALYGEDRTREIIPTDTNDGLADDYTLAQEYNNKDTTNIRREQIIEARIKAGRSGGLPVIK